MSTLTIIRGLPGSGKSTMAHALAANSGAIVIEPDSLLVSNGRYYYSESAYKRACQACRFLLGICARMDADCIYADVLPARIDIEELIKVYRSWKTGESVVYFEVRSLMIPPDESIRRNRHAVRAEDIAAMAEAWQSFPGEYKLNILDPATAEMKAEELLAFLKQN